MNRDQERRHLAEAERHIAQAQKRVARQRQIVEAAMDRGRPSDEGELLLQIFESNLRTLEGHRRLIVERLEAKDSRGRRPRAITTHEQNAVGWPASRARIP
jgi:16S rRNA G1207 methylase RsmC